MTSKPLKLHRLIRDMSSVAYHSTPNTFSSSQFKDLIKDEDMFIEKHIKKSVEREENDAFDIGNYFHTAVLEPHKVKTECVVFPGRIRRGKDWEKFKLKNRGKAIVTKGQMEQALGLAKAVKNSPVAQDYLDGEPEVSLFVELVIFQNEIYAPFFGKKLTRDGWIEARLPKKTPGAFTIVVKVRADNLGEAYISDLKSTSGNARSDQSVKEVVRRYQYDLSAALYLDIFSLLNVNLCAFWLIFASKELYNSRSYVFSDKSITCGRAKYMWAILRLAECAKNKWEYIDYPGVLHPHPDDLEWLVERDTDLL